MDQQQIGSFIRQCREEQNLTQQQLADKLGVTNKAVSKWETGEGMPPFTSNLRKNGNFFGSSHVCFQAVDTLSTA